MTVYYPVHRKLYYLQVLYWCLKYTSENNTKQYHKYWVNSFNSMRKTITQTAPPPLNSTWPIRKNQHREQIGFVPPIVSKNEFINIFVYTDILVEFFWFPNLFLHRNTNLFVNWTVFYCSLCTLVKLRYLVYIIWFN